MKDQLTLPLETIDDGTIRLRGTRIALEAILHHYKLGATPEQIALKFPDAPLSNIYACIALYLENQAELETYLQRQETGADAVQQLIESDSTMKQATTELRQKLLARWATRRQAA